jgi:hypothetical protein
MQAFLNVFKSKTIWFGLLLAIVTWFQGFMNNSGLSAQQLAVVGPVVGLVVVWLRSVTSVPLSQK